MVFREDSTLRESLIGRIVFDVNGVKGHIISVMPIAGKDQCEVAVRFEDNTCTMDTRFDAQTWFDKSTTKH